MGRRTFPAEFQLNLFDDGVFILIDSNMAALWAELNYFDVYRMEWGEAGELVFLLEDLVVAFVQFIVR